MATYPIPGFRPSGQIGPRRFIKVDAGNYGCVVQAGAGDPAIGISQAGAEATPGLRGSDPTVAASAGGVLMFYGPGETGPVDVGAVSIAAGAFVKSDASGMATPATPGDEVCGRVWYPAVPGQQVLCTVMSRKM